MAREKGPKCRRCRREGVKLFLKGARCDTKKCPVEERPVPPGEHAFRRQKVSEYGKRLREKQKVKRFYGIGERQFIRYFNMAERQKGSTGVNLLLLLERRIDNVVHIIGWAPSRAAARQMIAHGHLRLNGRRHRSASCLVRPNDTIEVSRNEKIRKLVTENEQEAKRRRPEWVEVDSEALVARVLRHPVRDEVSVETQENLIVEFCSR